MMKKRNKGSRKLRKTDNRVAIDKAKAEALFRKYNRIAFLAAYRKTQNEENAREAVQETFARIFEHWDTVQTVSEEALQRYIYAAAKNTAIDLFLREGGKELVAENGLVLREEVPEASAEELALKREEKRRLRRLIAKLRKEEGELIELV
ncbi:MAG: hypothetical protein IJC68_04825, partial [Firmicutes bacterium]|nr:hypothetical protein [Bacillota bacterium]